METMFTPLGKALFYLCLILVGASTWIALERFRVIEPMCLVTQDVVDGFSK